MISKHSKHQEKQMWEPSHSFLEPQLNSQGKDEQQDLAQHISGMGGIWDQWEWRRDLREALCQKPSQKSKMEHSSRPAG